MKIVQGRYLITGRYSHSGYTIYRTGQASIACVSLAEARKTAISLLGYKPKWEKLIRLNGCKKQVEYHIKGNEEIR